MAAQHDVDLGADAGRDRLLHRARIEDGAEGHVVDLGVDQGLQHRRRVVVAAAARIVGAVGHHQRSLLANARLGRRDRIGDRPVVRGVHVAPLPDLVEQFGRHLARALLGAGLVADRDRRAGIGNVGPGEARLDADDVDTRLLLEGIGPRQQVAHQAGLGGLAGIRALQHGGLDQQALRLLLALQRLLDQRRSLHRSLVAVDVRIGPVTHQRIGVARHRGRRIGMQVERGNDRNVRPDDGTQGAEQCTLRIVLGLRDCRAMQRQADRVEPARLLRRPEDQVSDMLPGLPGEFARGRRIGRGGPDRLPAVLLHRIDVAADLVLRAREPRHHRLALDQPALAVVLQRGLQFTEGIGLVHELRDQDAVRHFVTPTLSAYSLAVLSHSA